MSSPSPSAPAINVTCPSGFTTSYPGVLLPVDDPGEPCEEEDDLVPWVTELPSAPEPIKSKARSMHEIKEWLAKKVQEDLVVFHQANEDDIYEELGDEFSYYYHLRVDAADFAPFKCRLCGYDAQATTDKRSRAKLRGHLGLTSRANKRCPHVEQKTEKPRPAKKAKTKA